MVTVLLLSSKLFKLEGSDQVKLIGLLATSICDAATLGIGVLFGMQLGVI